MMKKNVLLLISLFLSLLAVPQYVFATVTVTTATGGSAISADTTGGAYTALTGPVISEGVTGDVGTGTIILNVPTGFIFDTGGTAPTILITWLGGGSGAGGDNLNNKTNGTVDANVTRTTTQITYNITAVTTNSSRNSLTWQNIRVRPTAVTPLASGDIIKTGTSVIAGITNSVTNLGTLTEVAVPTPTPTPTPTPSSTPTPTPSSNQPDIGTINVVKVVVNDNGGTKNINNFPLFVNGISVISGETNFFTAPATVYTVSETGDSNYARSFSGDCDFNGQLNLNPGQNKFCIVTNNDIGTGTTTQSVAPLIDVTRVPIPLSLPAGPGPLIYTYTLHNIGTVPITTVNLFDNSCDSVELISGDINNDSRIDVNEIWMYACSTIILETRTGTVTATGWANGISTIDIASSTVIVGVPGLPATGAVPPLIHVTKVPNPLTLSAGGGTVTYTYKITNLGMAALDYVYLNDDHCSPILYISGDINSDLKLDTTETWTLTCQTNLIKTTTNTVSARGEANGLIARDLAVVTVVVPAGLSSPDIRSVIPTLAEGSTGGNVKILQQFLVSENKGPASRALGAHGTTFYFGPLTKAALIEWQTAVGISPATGSFGPATRDYINAHFISSTPGLPNTGSLSISDINQHIKEITANLAEGSTGGNVKILQQFLVSENKGPASRALGTHGTTLYFGPLTKAALIEWQTAVGITPATGTFGPATRDYLDAH